MLIQVENAIARLRRQNGAAGRIAADCTRRSRIGVLGANGAGKTTLMRTLAGDLAPLQSGDLFRGQHSSVGYFAQHQLELLQRRRSARSEHLRLRTPVKTTDQIRRTYLGGWGFAGDMAMRPTDRCRAAKKPDSCSR